MICLSPSIWSERSACAALPCNRCNIVATVLKIFFSDKEVPQGGFKMREITAEEMNKLIKGLKGKKSCGLDWICGFSLKIAAPTLAEELRFLTNL